MAIHPWWDISDSVQALELLICVQLLHIFLRSYSNAMLVFAFFVILFCDFLSWISPLQLCILSFFMSSNTCSCHRLFDVPLALLKFGFSLCHCLHYFFFSFLCGRTIAISAFISFTMFSSCNLSGPLSSSVFGRIFLLLSWAVDFLLKS